MKKLHFVYLVFVAFSSFSGKPLDEEVKKHPILGPLIELLDKYKMDALGNWKGTAPAKITRTTIAPLNGDYPINPDSRLTHIESFESLNNAFEKEFRIGALGGIVANEKSSLNKNVSFYDRWGKEKGKRIFISFASEDYKKANILRKILRANGYIAFTYLNSKGNTRYSPRKVGEFLQTADHVIVIDTKTARKKRGIILETKIIKELEAGRLRTQKEDHQKEIERLKKENSEDLKKNNPDVRLIIEKRTKTIKNLEKQIRKIEFIERRRVK